MRATKIAAMLALGSALMLAPGVPAQTNEELQKQIGELAKRVEALERQLQSQAPAQTPRPRTPAPTAPAAANAGRDEALALYRKIDGLVATGNINQAHRELTAFNDKHAGTDAAGWTRSLGRELEVVGKAAPDDWKIEKWFQGESEVELDGSRPTLLVFWESWCPHCRNEMPKLQALYEDLKEQGLQVLGVTRITKTATEESVRAFIDTSGITYPIAKETGDLANYFNVKGIPAAAYVANGKIVWRGHPVRLTDELMGIWF